jgi:hypothetical protein
MPLNGGIVYPLYLGFFTAKIGLSGAVFKPVGAQSK